MLDVVKVLNSAHGGVANFGRKWWEVVIHVPDVIAIEPITRPSPPMPTKAEIRAAAAEQRRYERAQEQAARKGRTACSGGCELVVCYPGATPIIYLVARPVADVVSDLLTAERRIAYLDDGLGSAITVRISHIVAVRALRHARQQH